MKFKIFTFIVLVLALGATAVILEEDSPGKPSSSSDKAVPPNNLDFKL